MSDKIGAIHIVGGGIAGLAAAVFAIRDGKIPGGNIHIYEEGRAPDADRGGNVLGGALDANDVPKRGYVMRGGRMFESKYACTYDLLEGIPVKPGSSVDAKQDILDFTNSAPWCSAARLVDVNCNVLNVKSMGFSIGDQLALGRLIFRTCEEELGKKRIDEVLPDHFFDTNFWLMWATMFSFQPWHSASEMRRYLRRFIHLFAQIGDLSCVQHTRYNQFDSMVKPILDWLGERYVVFEQGVEIVDLDLTDPDATGQYRVRALKAQSRDAGPGAPAADIALNDGDVVLVTNGSMTDAATLGDWNTPAPLNPTIGGAWELWKKLAPRRPGAFGDPDSFLADSDKSKWLSFTVTTRSKKFADRLFELSKQRYGRDGLITFKRSSWLLTLHAHYSPVSPEHEKPERKDELVWWGYGLCPDNTGDFIRKRMADCTGRELLEESLRHLRVNDAAFNEIMDEKMTTSVPCMMPWITSQFMPRAPGDRPAVRPKGAENLAFIGQFAEAEKDCVFTVEYSVRTAKMAIASLFGDKAIKVEPMYEGYKEWDVLLKAAWVSSRPSWWPFAL